MLDLRCHQTKGLLGGGINVREDWGVVVMAAQSAKLQITAADTWWSAVLQFHSFLLGSSPTSTSYTTSRYLVHPILIHTSASAVLDLVAVVPFLGVSPTCTI